MPLPRDRSTRRSRRLVADRAHEASHVRRGRARGDLAGIVSAGLSLVASIVFVACGSKDHAPAPSATASASPVTTITATASEAPAAAMPVIPAAPPPPRPSCPPDMVRVEPRHRSGDLETAPAYCVDRYECTVVDKNTKKPATPYYPPDPVRSALFEKIWIQDRGGGTAIEQSMPLPPLPSWEKDKKTFVPMAISVEGAVPQAYTSEIDADAACKNAGKRLCTMGEWRTACRGEDDRDFPYGDTYEAGKCNIFGPAHPGVILWNDPSINHTDPRFNLVKYKGSLLLRRTGATKTCVSRWGDDGIYDMNGNVDEWVDDRKGMFLGGFYARGKKDGCKSRVTAHVPSYSDYSTGFRCCRDAEIAPAPAP